MPRKRPRLKRMPRTQVTARLRDGTIRTKTFDWLCLNYWLNQVRFTEWAQCEILSKRVIDPGY